MLFRSDEAVAPARSPHVLLSDAVGAANILVGYDLSAFSIHQIASSDQVSRVWPYSGTRAALAVFIYVTLTLFGWPSHAIRLTAKVLNAVHTPEGFLLPVCPLPRSLATTNGISFDVSSSPYLDVSVQAVPLLYLWIQYRIPEYELW